MDTNRYYCSKSTECDNAAGCSQAVTEEVILAHYRIKAKIKYNTHKPMCFKKKQITK